MPRIRIDQHEIDAAEGMTVLEAAESAGVRIPHLCYLKGIEPQTSCLVCVVRINCSTRMVPSCATKVTEGMAIESESASVRTARKTAIELLLAEHAGECFAPCSQVCPAHLDIPDMIRLIRENDVASAAAIARDALVLPAVLGYVCPGLCEKGCRRGAADEAVSICALHRFAAEEDMKRGQPWMPAVAPSTGKKVAVVGAGPAGLAAAYELTKAGHRCTVYDHHPHAGGTLRYGLEPGKLPEAVLDAEVALLTELGVTWSLGNQITDVAALRTTFDAVAVTSGKLPEGEGHGLFVSASATSTRPHAVQAVADGKELAKSVDAFLRGQVHAATRKFAVRLGAMNERELKQFMSDASESGRVMNEGQTLSESQAQCESGRCMMCGCESTEICALRRIAQEYGAEPTRYKGDRRPIRTISTHPDIVFEEGKCISCGLCVAIARRAGEPLGLTFVGRGFNVTVAAPLSRDWSDALTVAADEAVRACPTGAIHRIRAAQ